MSNELSHIDTSGIGALKEVKVEHNLVKDRLEKMISMKSEVSEAVYQKVYDEYSTKLDVIADKAEPLKCKLRVQYQVLSNLLDRLQMEFDKIKLEREELEFRHTLGEFDDDFFQAEMERWESKDASKQAELAESNSMKEEFLSVFNGPDDLEMPQDLNTIPVENIMPKEPEVAPVVESEETPEGEEATELGLKLDTSLSFDADDDLEEKAFIDESESLPSPESNSMDTAESTSLDDIQLMPELPEELDDNLNDDIATSLIGEFKEELEEDLDDSLDDSLEDSLGDSLLNDSLGGLDFDGPAPRSTVSMALEETAKGDDVPVPPTASGKDATLMMEQLPLMGSNADGEPETLIIATPKIISMNKATEGQTIVLGMGTTSMGRSPDNDIHITEDRISRKHSQITFGPGGYALYDLNSENGSFVNGQRVREHFLQDGDIIQVGTFKYLYRDH